MDEEKQRKPMTFLISINKQIFFSKVAKLISFKIEISYIGTYFTCNWNPGMGLQIFVNWTP